MSEYKLLMFYGATISARYFGKHERRRERNFSIRIEDPFTEERLKAEGWNVRREPHPTQVGVEWAYLRVVLNYEKDPKVVLIDSSGERHLGLDEVGVLDTIPLDISEVDLIISPHEWSVGKKSGVKAYVQDLRVTVGSPEKKDI